MAGNLLHLRSLFDERPIVTNELRRAFLEFKVVIGLLGGLGLGSPSA